MKILSRLIIVVSFFCFIFGCGGNGGTSTSSTPASSNINAISCKNARAGGNLSLTNPASGINVLPVTLNGNYANAPMTSVKICEPGTTNCTVVDNILVDTGSYGLRIFQSVLSNLSLAPVNSSASHPLAECAQFGIGSTWGPIKNADIVLGGEQAVNISIQVIDSNFATKPQACSGADTDPATAGYNGILGVGLFKEDCGTSCVSINPPPDLYYSCNGSSCTTSNISLASQVTNPVSKLGVDNNGVILELPAIPNCGVQIVSGTLILGIGTKANNTSSATSIFMTNSFGEFSTTFNGHNYTQSFIDSGSNGFFFPRTSLLPSCSQPIQGGDISTFNCPYDTLNLIAIQTSGSTQKSISFSINNVYNLFTSQNFNFNDISANWNSGFNWGLPFFYGRKVFVGIEGKASPIGTGPYWAY
jgi:hypothetical protein